MEKIKVNLIPGEFIGFVPEVENGEYLLFGKKEINMWENN